MRATEMCYSVYLIGNIESEEESEDEQKPKPRVPGVGKDETDDVSELLRAL